jgi:hypothetical protein
MGPRVQMDVVFGSVTAEQRRSDVNKVEAGLTVGGDKHELPVKHVEAREDINEKD